MLAAVCLVSSCAVFGPLRRAELGAVSSVRTSDAFVPRWTTIAQGIGYCAFAVERPRLDAHALRVELDSPGVSVVVSEDAGKPPITVSRKVSSFLIDKGCVAAVNANPFDPSSDIEGENRFVVGLSISAGKLVSPPDARYAALLFGYDGRAAVAEQGKMDSIDGIRNAVGGFFIVLDDGLPVGHPSRRYPRTAAGVSSDGRTLFLLVIDGRRLGSVGATEPETGRLLERMGAWNGLILDGGGSSVMVLRDSEGRAVVANVPGSERAVGNSLGIRANR